MYWKEIQYIKKLSDRLGFIFSTMRQFIIFTTIYVIPIRFGINQNYLNYKNIYIIYNI